MLKAATHMRDKHLMTWTLGLDLNNSSYEASPNPSIPRGRRENRVGTFIRHRKSQNPHGSPHGNKAVNDDEEEATLQWDSPQAM